ncbi:DNA polymerase III subunit psi [uncultured Paraglaciecola sp.]|uniref:DNA polymerase III subunit psi n=1 Tax=uncultured Paraglaciecola sp. TaxID=1765024 RepID=UPI0030D9375C|tara:strand:- start:1126 stop:1626 length:501 start_codon:yes stop_codon:yes gene_type:complete
MENTSHLVLSDYQRAVLNEMGIVSWQLVNQKQNQPKVENQTSDPVVTSSDVVSRVDALEKLKQLKVQTQKNETTDAVLVTCSQSDAQLQIFTDVLIALGLEAKELKYVSTEQLSHYSDYPLSWVIGDNLGFQNKQLITPPLSELYQSATKKQLWLQLQSAKYLIEC